MSMRKTFVVTAAVVVVLALGFDAVTWAVTEGRLLYDSEQGVKTDAGGRRYVPDASGLGHDGHVRSANGGGVAVVTPGYGGAGKALKFPRRCDPTTDTCPKAMIQASRANPDDLNPGLKPFSFGAAVLIRGQDQLTLNGGGMNIVQKGLISDPDGQWKLQVDGSTPDAALPGCAVRDKPAGQDAAVYRLVTAKDVDPTTPEVDGIADGKWHKIVCQIEDKETSGRLQDRLSILIDGRTNNYKDYAQIGAIANGAPVTVGAKWLPMPGDPKRRQVNDQFHGTLDDVFFRLD